MTWYVGDNSTNNGSLGMIFESVSVINVSNLVLTLQQKIDSSTNERDLLYYSKAIQQLRTGNVFVVNNITELPSAENNLGSLYYVNNDELVYFSSTLGWAQLYEDTAKALFAWGQNTGGVLGDGTITAKCSPIREFCSSTDWCQVSMSIIISTGAAIKTSGQLWAWGSGSSGQLGDGTLTNRCSPVREFCSATDWCQVGAGYTHTLAVKTSGQLWSWGSSACGEIGDGFKFTRNSPVREICSATDWCQASASYRRSAAIKTSGELWAWGCNTDGLLGDGTTTSRCSPVREFCSATDWCQVSAGRCHSLALKTSGELWAWGVNTCGPLGNGILSVAASCSPIREFYSATDWCYVNAGCIFSLAINAKTVVCR
jgi:alpha-tubulin suppressor-like RCC1 family protein